MKEEDLKEFADILFAPTMRDIYKERIDKAIEYIEDGDLLYLASKCSVIYRLIELLDILKGSDKE